MDFGVEAGGPAPIADQGCPTGLEVGRGTVEESVVVCVTKLLKTKFRIQVPDWQCQGCPLWSLAAQPTGKRNAVMGHLGVAGSQRLL